MKFTIKPEQGDALVKAIEMAFKKEIPEHLLRTTAKHYQKMMKGELKELSVTGKTMRTTKYVRNLNLGNYENIVIARSKNPALALLEPPEGWSTDGILSLLGYPKRYYLTKDYPRDAKYKKLRETQRTVYSPFIAKWASARGITRPRGLLRIGHPTFTKWGKPENAWYSRTNTHFLGTAYNPIKLALRRGINTIKNEVL